MKFKRYVAIFIIVTGLLILILYVGNSNRSNIINDGFTVDKAVEDYLYMWSEIEENYTLLPVVNRYNKDLDVKAIKNQYLEEIKSKDSITIYEFFQIANMCISKFNGLGHLDMFYPQAYQMYKVACNNFGVDLPKDAQHIKDTVLTNNLDDLYNYIASNQNSSMNFKSLSSLFSSEDNIVFKKIANNIAYVNIKSFLIIDKDVLLEWYRENADTENIIIDISNNGGGATMYWEDYIVKPNIDSPIDTINYVLMSDGGDTARFYEGDKLYKVSELLDELNKLPNINSDDLDSADLVTKEIRTIMPDSNEKILKGNIYVIIGPRTFSASDSFADFCKATGFATLVGSKTSGDGLGYGTPIVKMMPNSKLLFRYSYSFGLDSEGRNNALIGTLPDVNAGNKNPLEICIKYINDNSIRK